MPPPDKFLTQMRDALKGKDARRGFYLGPYWVPGVNDEIEPEKTLRERLLAWAVDTPIHAAEREYLLQCARRTKLATDLQANRIERLLAKKREREEAATRPTHVGVWTRGSFNRGNGADRLARVALTERPDGKRGVKLVTLVTAETGKDLGVDGETFTFLQGLPEYHNYIVPWMAGHWDDAKLVKRWANHGKAISKLHMYRV